MPRPRNARSTKPRPAFVLPKPNGLLTPRVQAVGPEHLRQHERLPSKIGMLKKRCELFKSARNRL